MCPGLCGGPKANWHRKAYLHAILVSRRAGSHPTHLLGTGAGSRAVPGIVLGEHYLVPGSAMPGTIQTINSTDMRVAGPGSIL